MAANAWHSREFLIRIHFECRLVLLFFLSAGSFTQSKLYISSHLVIIFLLSGTENPKPIKG